MTEPVPPPRPPASIAPEGAPPPTEADEVDLGKPQRQSVLAIVFLAIKTVQQIGIVQVVFAFGFAASQSPSILVLIFGVFIIGALLLIVGALRWWRYTFFVRAGELHVDRGVVSRDTLTVPLDRVQSVSIEQKFLHRLVSLVEVSLDTAGTDAAEFTFDAVDRQVARELQRVASDYQRSVERSGSPSRGAGPAHRRSENTDSPAAHRAVEERTILRHSPARLVRLGLSRVPFSGLAFLAPILAFGDDLVERVPFSLPDVEVELGLWLLWFVPVAIVGVAVFGLFLNLVGTFLRDWDLRVIQTESGLRREAGLLSTTSVASSVSRVQSIETRQGLLQRLFGLQHVTLHNIGEGDFLVPGCTAEEIARIRSVGLQESAGVDSIDRRVSTAEVFRDTRNAGVICAVLAVGLFFVIEWWVLLFVLPVVGEWLRARRRVGLRRWGIDSDSVAIRNELLAWRTHEALLRKTNGVVIRQSYFERSRGLATVQIRLAGGILNGQISIGMIPADEAAAVRDYVLYIVESGSDVNEASWM